MRSVIYTKLMLENSMNPVIVLSNEKSKAEKRMSSIDAFEVLILDISRRPQ